ncbi:Unknown protein, partial [Striga hermonthica]
SQSTNHSPRRSTPPPPVTNITNFFPNPEFIQGLTSLIARAMPRNSSTVQLSTSFPTNPTEHPDTTHRNLETHAATSHATSQLHHASPRREELTRITANPWQQLHASFRSHFIGAQVCLIPKESITNIVQKDDEIVKDYLSRFNDRIQNMEPCHPETLLVTAIVGLRPNSMFRWTLCQNKPATFQEFLVRAQQFIIAEESMSVPSFDFSVKENKAESDVKKKNKMNFGRAQYRNYSKGNEDTPESRAARDQYADNVRTGYQTVYSAGAATIFEELKGKGIIPDPKPVRTSEDKLDKSRYCAYHKSPGHNTDE